MNPTVCKSCGTTATRAENCGFNGWFLFFWASFGVCLWLGLYAWIDFFLVAACIKTVAALFQWRRVCATCGSTDLIPADSPVGRKLLAE